MGGDGNSDGEVPETVVLNPPPVPVINLTGDPELIDLTGDSSSDDEELPELIDEVNMPGILCTFVNTHHYAFLPYEKNICIIKALSNQRCLSKFLVSRSISNHAVSKAPNLKLCKIFETPVLHCVL